MLIFYFLSDDERRRKSRRKREDEEEDEDEKRREEEEEQRNAKMFYFSNIRKLLRKASTRGPRIAVYRHPRLSGKEERSKEDPDEGEKGEEKELVSV